MSSDTLRQLPSRTLLKSEHPNLNISNSFPFLWQITAFLNKYLLLDQIITLCQIIISCLWTIVTTIFLLSVLSQTCNAFYRIFVIIIWGKIQKANRIKLILNFIIISTFILEYSVKINNNNKILMLVSRDHDSMLRIRIANIVKLRKGLAIFLKRFQLKKYLISRLSQTRFDATY